MQTSRLFEIVYILSEKRSVTAKELAETFEVSTRTIYRDIELLSGSGIPIYTDKGKGGGIRLLEGYTLDKSVMTKEEKRLLISGLQAVAAVKPQGNDELLNKLDAWLGKEEDNWLEIDFGNWGETDSEQIYFEQLKDAIFNKRVVTIDYVSTQGLTKKREIEPLKLIFRSMSWYLYAYCRTREDFRFFKLRRMHNLIVTENKFKRSYSDNVLEQKDQKETYLEGAKIHLKLLFDDKVSYRVFDEMKSFRMLENGKIEVEWDTYENDYLYDYILSFREHAKVLEPQGVREKLREIIEKLHDHYMKESEEFVKFVK